eukprot:2762026-Rhodomonas_salina.4
MAASVPHPRVELLHCKLEHKKARCSSNLQRGPEGWLSAYDFCAYRNGGDACVKGRNVAYQQHTLSHYRTPHSSICYASSRLTRVR